MERLRIRAYNVQFGDAILVSFPDKDEKGQPKTRHMLIDVGNVLSTTKGGADDLFRPVVEDVLEVLGGEPLDLYVMTHEHLDHVQGLPYAEEKCYTGSDDQLCKELKTRFAWLTASAEEGYYERHDKARKKRLALMEAYGRIDRYMKAYRKSGEPIPPAVEALWLNNNPSKTGDCVKYLRGLTENTSYVHRCFDPEGRHPFREAKIKVWAPEEDTSVYYGRSGPLAMGLEVTEPPKGSREWPTLTPLKPPPGVDAGAFYKLVEMRRGHVENLLMIDKAANNTSVVFCLEWRGLRFLFTGDAEERSWRTMAGQGVLEPVHFLKVSHHGSQNGTPEKELLENVLPTNPTDGKRRCALVSTRKGVYNNVPDDDTLRLLGDRCESLCEVHRLSSDGGYVDIYFDEGGYVETRRQDGPDCVQNA